MNITCAANSAIQDRKHVLNLLRKLGRIHYLSDSTAELSLIVALKILLSIYYLVAGHPVKVEERR